MFGVDRKPTQSNKVKPTLRDSREGKLNEDIGNTLESKNEYDDSQYASPGSKNPVKRNKSKPLSRGKSMIN